MWKDPEVENQYGDFRQSKVDDVDVLTNIDFAAIREALSGA